MAHVLSVSMPRSGHHLFETLLRAALGNKLVYCEFYGPGCCRNIPCTSAKNSIFIREGIFLQKSHDFDFLDPVDVPNTSRVIQYRSPVPRALSNYELHLRNGAEDNIQTFRNFLVNEALYYRTFYHKWLMDRRTDRLLLSYEELTGDPLKAVVSFFSHTGINAPSPTEVSERIAPVLGKRAVENVAFIPRDVRAHRYAQYPVLANFEDIVLRSCPGYFPTRYFTTEGSDKSLIGIMYNALRAIEERDYDRANLLAEGASREIPNDPIFSKIREKLVSARLVGTTKPTKRRPALSPLEGSAIIATSDIEVVMLTYNEEDMLPYSLPPLATYLQHFLILDMGSTDQTLRVVHQHLRERARIIRYDREKLLALGYAHARNFAAGLSSRPWLLVVDADEVLEGNIDGGGITLTGPSSNLQMASLNLRNFRKAGWRVGKQLDVTKLTIERVVTGKKRIYRPSGSVLWKGYIHEELHDQSRSPIAESNLTLNHLTVFRSQERQQEKRHMYAWMLLRLMDEKELREGVNRFWYEEFIPKNRQQLENDARLFDEVRL